MNFKKHLPILENFVSYFLFKAIDAVIPLIVITYLIDVVGLNNYGYYAFAYALIFYLQNIIQFGFDLSAVRSIALLRDDKQKLSKVYNDVFSAQIVFFVLVTIFLLSLVLFVPRIYDHYIIYCFFFILLVGELLFPMWFFLGVERMKFMTIISVISKSTFAILCFLLIKHESDYIYISLYHSVGFLFAGIIAQIIIRKTFGIKFRFSKVQDIKATIIEAWSAFLTMVSPTIYHNTSIFLVGVYGIPSFVSVMEIGAKVLGAFKVVITIMSNVLFPFLNRNKSYLPKVRLVFVTIGFTLSLVMFFSSEILMHLWLGDDAVEVIRVVKFLSPGPLLSSIISAYGINGLMIMKKDKLYSKIIVIGSVIGLMVGLIFIPKYYYIGGAIAIISATSVKAIFSCFYSVKTIKQLQNR
ncbi:oligosaccharide flippase family protein [Pontimicrobium aquaticum]|uniref:oligosaccharide flippase family protein n=1 Tax=Pontimicrobium aquaticum TaxID=2565367 RepID=UPI00145D4055|nr:oligosaccharide flippase family protein [Pontimicrobium aquaticum]